MAALNEPTRISWSSAATATRRACERLAAGLDLAPRVHFAGGQQDVAPWYGLADCFVLATLYDPMPNAALEALACGLPVVVTEQCGAAELVQGAAGAVCDAFSALSLVAAMRTVARGDPGTQRTAARAAVADLGLDAMGARLEALYETLLARGDGGRGGIIRASAMASNRNTNSLQLYLRLLGYVRPYWKVFAASILAMTVVSLTEPLFPALMKPLLDGSFVEKDRSLLKWLPLVIVGIFVLRGVASFVSRLHRALGGAKVVADLRNAMFGSWCACRPRYYDNRPPAR